MTIKSIHITNICIDVDANAFSNKLWNGHYKNQQLKKIVQNSFFGKDLHQLEYFNEC